jgi:hypothetical protein
MAKPKKNQGGRPKVPVPRSMIASFRGSPEFAEWFQRLVAYLRIPGSSAIEKGLILLAREEGFDEEAPKR